MRIEIVDCTVDGADEILVVLASCVSEIIDASGLLSDGTLWLNVLDGCVSCCYETFHTPVFRLVLDGCDLVVSDDLYSYYCRLSVPDPKFVDVLGQIVVGRVKAHTKDA